MPESASSSANAAHTMRGRTVTHAPRRVNAVAGRVSAGGWLAIRRS
jgi:hypothetical protein